MKIFIGGTLSTRYSLDLKLNVLESFFTIGRKELKIDKEYVKSLFIDSGAYSAWSQKKSINLDNYINYIKRNKDKIDYYANLDEIYNPEKSAQNLAKMESEGLNPIPVYHYGERFKIFEEMCKKYNLIALGGMVPISTKDLIPWLDDIFSYICDKEGNSIKKLHGFGMTTLELMKKYPWFSVDSISPIITAAMGGIFNHDGQIISVAQKKQIPYAIQLYLKKELKNQHQLLGDFDFDKIRRSYKARIIINLRFIMKLEEELIKNPPRFIQKQNKFL